MIIKRSSLYYTKVRDDLKQALGHNIKKYSGTFHYKPGNNHVHFLVMSQVPKSRAVIKARIAAPMSLAALSKCCSTNALAHQRDQKPAEGVH